MKGIFSTLVTLLSFHLMLAQNKLPVFQSPTDSAQYSMLTRLINDEFMKGEKVNGKKVDSLMILQAGIKTKIVGYQYSFNPSYILSDQLNQEGKDTATVLSIKDKRAIPREVYQCKNLKTLELVNTRIKKLPRKLNTLHQLSTLKVYTNKIERPLKLAKNSTIKTLVICSAGIPKKFNAYRSLQKLDLSRNNLEKFPVIKGCKNLKQLSLKENNITLDDLSHPSGSNLEGLELQHNKIKSVPESLTHFTKLKKLTLNYNEIVFIHPGFSQLKNLEQLGLYQNNLTSIPDAVYALGSLKEIDLYYNPIERLESKASNWQKLEVLYLANTKLLSLPDNLGELKSLRELYLHHNRISVLPESIGDLQHLKVLRVNQNHLNTLPDAIIRLASIENIDIAGNYLQTLPEGIFEFKHLKILSLFNNPWDVSIQNLIYKEAKRLIEKEIVVHYDEPQPDSL